jgi:hypothetical protein
VLWWCIRKSLPCSYQLVLGPRGAGTIRLRGFIIRPSLVLSRHLSERFKAEYQVEPSPVHRLEPRNLLESNNLVSLQAVRETLQGGESCRFPRCILHPEPVDTRDNTKGMLMVHPGLSSHIPPCLITILRIERRKVCMRISTAVALHTSIFFRLDHDLEYCRQKNAGGSLLTGMLSAMDTTNPLFSPILDQIEKNLQPAKWLICDLGC